MACELIDISSHFSFYKFINFFFSVSLFQELPTVAAYRKSDRFKARPINNKIAPFK